MGNLRLVKLCSLLSGSALAFFSGSVDGQTSHRFGDQARPQQAYYQPLSQTQSQQHQQTAYAQDLGQNGFTSGSNDFNSGQSAQGQSLQERADALLRSGSLQSDSQFYGQRSSFPRRRQIGNNVGYRRLQDQDDPFGEKQAQPVIPPQQQDNQFDPFADPPAQDTQPAKPIQKPVQQADPFGEAQFPPTQQPIEAEPPIGQPADVTPPPQTHQEPTATDPIVDPFADPSPTDQGMQPTERSSNQQPQIEPREENYPPNAIVPRSDENPKEMPKPDTLANPQSNEPYDYEDGLPYREPDVIPSSDDEMESSEKMAPSNVYRAPQNIYRAPEPRSMPPIVQPSQSVPYQTQPRMTQPRMDTLPQMAPPYQSPYQPIPGIDQTQSNYQPNYDQQNYMQPAIPQPQLTTQVPGADPSVYSPVVGQCGSGCQTCDEGCPNFYFNFFGGLSDLRDLESRSGLIDIATESGEGFGVALGRRNGRNLRTEAEFSYRQNDFNGTITSGPLASQSFSGGLTSYAGMANAYWEFIDVPTGCFKPYIGVGVGFVGVDVEAIDNFDRSLIPNSADGDTSLAYQWMAGVNYKAYRNMDLFAEYRFFKADSMRIDSSVAALSDRYNYETDNVFFGMRWKF